LNDIILVFLSNDQLTSGGLGATACRIVKKDVNSNNIQTDPLLAVCV
jgi:hypothetical protein